MNNLTKNWKSVLIYLVIFAMLIGSILYFANNRTTTEVKYSQIVSMFENGEIADFTLDLSSGSLVYKTFKDPKVEQEYTVPNVSLFLDDITDDVEKFNADEKNKNNKIVYVVNIPLCLVTIYFCYYDVAKAMTVKTVTLI